MYLYSQVRIPRPWSALKMFSGTGVVNHITYYICLCNGVRAVCNRIVTMTKQQRITIYTQFILTYPHHVSPIYKRNACNTSVWLSKTSRACLPGPSLLFNLASGIYPPSPAKKKRIFFIKSRLIRWLLHHTVFLLFWLK